jgi:hypothetical protein
MLPVRLQTRPQVGVVKNRSSCSRGRDSSLSAHFFHEETAKLQLVNSFPSSSSFILAICGESALLHLRAWALVVYRHQGFSDADVEQNPHALCACSLSCASLPVQLPLALCSPQIPQDPHVRTGAFGAPGQQHGVGLSVSIRLTHQTAIATAKLHGSNK